MVRYSQSLHAMWRCVACPQYLLGEKERCFQMPQVASVLRWDWFLLDMACDIPAVSFNDC